MAAAASVAKDMSKLSVGAKTTAPPAGVIARTSDVSVEVKGRDNKEVFCLRYSPDSRFLAAGCGDGSIRVFNSVGLSLYTLSVPTQASLPVTCLRFRPPSGGSKTKNVLLAANADGSISHWHLMSQTCLFRLEEEDNQVYALDYRRDGEQFVSAGRDTKVRIYDESTKQLVRALTSGNKKAGTSGHSNRVYACKYMPNDPNVILSAGWDNTVQIWDVRAGHSVRNIYGPHVCGDALDIDPQGNTVVTASWRPEKALQVWDFGTGKLLQDVKWFVRGAKKKRESRQQGTADKDKEKKTEEKTDAAVAADATTEEKKEKKEKEAPKAPVQPTAAALAMGVKAMVQPTGGKKKRQEMLYAASFSPAGDVIMAGGIGSNQAKVFSTKEGDNYATMDTLDVGDHGVYTLTFAPNGRRAAVAGGEAPIKVIDFK